MKRGEWLPDPAWDTGQRWGFFGPAREDGTRPFLGRVVHFTLADGTKACRDDAREDVEFASMRQAAKYVEADTLEEAKQVPC